MEKIAIQLEDEPGPSEYGIWIHRANCTGCTGVARRRVEAEVSTIADQVRAWYSPAVYGYDPADEVHVEELHDSFNFAPCAPYETLTSQPITDPNPSRLIYFPENGAGGRESVGYAVTSVEPSDEEGFVLARFAEDGETEKVPAADVFEYAEDR
jgi:hypothetical protein